MQSSTNQSVQTYMITGRITPNKYIENSQHFGQNSRILWILNMGATHQVIISLPLDRYLF